MGYTTNSLMALLIVGALSGCSRPDWPEQADRLRKHGWRIYISVNRGTECIEARRG